MALQPLKEDKKRVLSEKENKSVLGEVIPENKPGPTEEKENKPVTPNLSDDDDFKPLCKTPKGIDPSDRLKAMFDGSSLSNCTSTFSSPSEE